MTYLKSTFGWLWVLVLTAQSTFAAEGVVKLELGTLHGKLKYDKEQLVVMPGARVELTFRNTDEMQHNWLLCKPGKNTALRIAQKAWALGAQAVQKQFVPEDPAVLVHSRILNPQESDTITFTAPTEPGDYPYVCTLPGHAFSMKGNLRVGTPDPEPGLRDLVYLYYEKEGLQKLPNFDELKPLRIKPLPANLFDLAPVQARPNGFAIQFWGELEVPKAGDYTFYVASDDGSRLQVGEQTVVDNDGIHPANEKQGTVSLKAGSHPVKLFYFQGAGERALKVAWKGPGFARRALSPDTGSGREIDKEKFHLHVMDEPLVMRTFIDGGPPRSIAVGLPGGLNYCFNADTCAVEFGWVGMFLDIGPNRGYGVDRGGGWSKILGERFELGSSGAPIRTTPTRGSTPRFLGYRRVGNPEFRYEIDGVTVVQSVQALPSTEATPYGLKLVVRTEGAPRDLYFEANRAKSKVEIKSSVGTWSGDLLHIPATEAREFTLTFIDPTAGGNRP